MKKNIPYNLSVIIPTFNEERFLGKLLDSIKLQTIPPAEIIVADNHSKDGTRKLARSYGCKITDGESPSKGRNNGAKIAQHKYLLFLDADVILPSPTFLRDCLNEMKKRNLDIASCLIAPLSSKKSDRLMFKMANISLKAGEKIYLHAMAYCIITKRSIHRKIKGFDESLKLAEDHDYVRRAAKYGKFRFLTSHKILVSTRRFDKEGRIKLALKYLISELHQACIGPIRKNIYKYEFGNFQ